MTAWTRLPRMDVTHPPDVDPAQLANATPYVHWFVTQDRPARDIRTTVPAPASLPSVFFQGRPREPDGIRRLFDRSLVKMSSPPKAKKSRGKYATKGLFAPLDEDDIIPLPPSARPDPDTPSAPPPWLPNDLLGAVFGPPRTGEDGSAYLARLRADLPWDTAILAVVDTDLALGHPRFRMRGDGGRPDTRFLAAWLQGGLHRGDAAPFGRDLFRDEIRTTLRAGHLDEAGFNAQMDPAAPGVPGLSDGARSLRARAGHGTHVLDIAAGADPVPASTEAAEEQRKRRLVAVALPDRASVGMAGTFLEYYVAFALKRIRHFVEALWQELYGEAGGFPVIVNLSYGQQAGPKTGTSLIEREFRKWRDACRVNKRGALELVMPVGNDNLIRGNARWKIRAGQQLPLLWRILPDDQSSNFIEVWGDLLAGEAADPETPFPLEVALTPPGETGLDWQAGRHGQVLDHDSGAVRIYSDIVPIADMTSVQSQGDAAEPEFPVAGRRLRYVLAMRPTLDHERPGDVGLAGAWRLHLRWAGDRADREVYVGVQVDQDPRPASRTSQRSYLDNDWLRTHHPSGRRLDTFAYTRSEFDLAGASGDLTPADTFGAVQRKGSQNALANERSVLMIAGHRASDGRPADFSATCYPEERLSPYAKAFTATGPAASFPIDRSPMRPGLLAAAPQSGGMATLRGTSFAAPQASRWAMDRLRQAMRLGRTDLRSVADRRALEAAAAQNETAVPAAPEAKLGKGRMGRRTG
ncbi:MAG: hypothetical protein AAF366_03390 [Pseudomonadota bacterium]